MIAANMFGSFMRIALLACSPIARDSRVLKTSATLSKQGHEVSVAGYGDAPLGLDARMIALSEPQPTTSHRLKTALTRLPANIAPPLALPLHARSRGHRQLIDALRLIKPDIIHANDWPTLPAAIAYKRETGCRVLYDSHEFAQAEHEERLYWRLVSQRFVRAVEGSQIGEADAVTTVSEGIADALHESYGLIKRPTVIANYPRFELHRSKPAGDVLQLLFHGLLTRSRGIERLIQATKLIQRPVVLTIRGNGAPGYVTALKAQAEASGDRVRFEPAVAPSAVVSAASTADIGFVLPNPGSRQFNFSMPNKLFEYIMAGLAVVTGHGRDMNQLMARTGCGFATAATTPAALAAEVDALTSASIDDAKARSTVAARTLSWDAQEPTLLAIYDLLAAQVSPSRRQQTV